MSPEASAISCEASAVCSALALISSEEADSISVLSEMPCIIRFRLASIALKDRLIWPISSFEV
ncbi:hypothetical protein D3C80_2103810 [compost metagenome]